MSIAPTGNFKLLFFFFNFKLLNEYITSIIYPSIHLYLRREADVSDNLVKEAT